MTRFICMKTLTHDHPRLRLYLDTFPAHSRLGNMKEVVWMLFLISRRIDLCCSWLFVAPTTLQLFPKTPQVVVEVYF